MRKSSTDETMNIYALELNNDIKGIEARKAYIEGLIAKLEKPDLVVLPELALCSYMGSTAIWQYADENGADTAAWAMQIAARYDTFIAAGYLEKSGGDYFNSYLIAGGDEVFGTVRKSEGESYIVKRGDFGNLIDTPFGLVAVGICYDSRRKRTYERIKKSKPSLILFPHGSPSNPKRAREERNVIDAYCSMYVDVFSVPVVYVNSVGKLDPMLGRMGKMMAAAGFVLNGMTKIYSKTGKTIVCLTDEAFGVSVELSEQEREKELSFYGEDIVPGNSLFRLFVLKRDIKDGIRFYEMNK